MQARTNDGKTRWKHAVESALALVNGAPVTKQFRIADTSGQFDSAFTENRQELRRLIERMRPFVGTTRFPDLEKTPAHFITDGVSRFNLPTGVTSISAFEPASNVGITAFEVRSTPTSPLMYEAYVEIYNSGKQSREVDVTVSGGGQQKIAKTVLIRSGEFFREAMDLSEFEGGGVRAAIRSDEDALPLDDVAFAYLPVKRRTRVQLVTRGNPFLETLLKAHSRVELSMANPQSFVKGADFDVFVFDRFAPPEAPSRPSLVIGAQDVSWLRKPVGNVEHPSFESQLEDHPVMRGVSLHDVTVDRARRIDATNLSVLAGFGSAIPLIVASEQPRWIMLTFDLQSSDLPYHAAFPVFVDNAMAWFGRDRLALRRTPGIVDVPIAKANIRSVDGSAVASRDHIGTTVFEAPDPGLYVASNDESRQYIAVNVTNRQHSEINNSRVRENPNKPAEASFLRHELWFYMLCAALLIFALEWWTYHRRITV